MNSTGGISSETMLTVIAGVLALLNGIMVFVLRGVRSEMSTLKAEIGTSLESVRSTVDTKMIGLTAKIDLHVIERLSRLETEHNDTVKWRRDVERQLAQMPRRGDDR